MQIIFELYIKEQEIFSNYYKLQQTTENSFFLQNHAGEGMEIKANDFYKLLDNYFKENF